MYTIRCGVCDYSIEMAQGPPADMEQGALLCSRCQTVMVYENGLWTPLADSDLAAKVRAYVKEKEQYKKEYARRFRSQWLN